MRTEQLDQLTKGSLMHISTMFAIINQSDIVFSCIGCSFICRSVHLVTLTVAVEVPKLTFLSQSEFGESASVQEGAVGVRQEQVQCASAAPDFSLNSSERRQAVEPGADAQLDVITGSTAAGSSMEPDIPAKWPSRRPPPTARKPSYSPRHSAPVRVMANMMGTELKVTYVPIC